MSKWDVPVMTRLSDEQREALRRLAVEEQRSESSVVRLAFQRFLDEREREVAAHG